MNQFQKDLDEDSESSDEDKDMDERVETTDLDVKEKTKKERKIQLVRLKNILFRIKEKDQSQNPIKYGALMEFKKDIMQTIQSFQYNLFSKAFYRFFSKHVTFSCLFIYIGFIYRLE